MKGKFMQTIINVDSETFILTLVMLLSLSALLISCYVAGAYPFPFETDAVKYVIGISAISLVASIYFSVGMNDKMTSAIKNTIQEGSTTVYINDEKITDASIELHDEYYVHDTDRENNIIYIQTPEYEYRKNK
jgi:hypothetical protein